MAGIANPCMEVDIHIRVVGMGDAERPHEEVWAIPHSSSHKLEEGAQYCSQRVEVDMRMLVCDEDQGQSC